MADIGTTLREARMRARIDISEVEERTKIRAKYLRAIENEEWDLLPGPVYVKSFLRTYGDFLGLDSRMLVESYKRRYERPSDHDSRPVGSIAREREREARGPLLPRWAVIGLVLVGIVVALYAIGSRTSSTKMPTTTGLHAHRAHPRGHQAPPVLTPTVPKTVTLQLVPTDTVYVCLVNGTGTKLIDQRTFSAGETIPSETAPELLLTLGRAAVHMQVNGRLVPIAASSTAIRLMLTPTTIHHIPPSMSPTCP
jgi:Helix-turn-helix domain